MGVQGPSKGIPTRYRSLLHVTRGAGFPSLELDYSMDGGEGEFVGPTSQ